MVDNVNSPAHYRQHPSGIEVIQITEHMNFCLGNAVKYILRCDHKGNAIEDLQKARYYIDREIARRGKRPEVGNLARGVIEDDPMEEAMRLAVGLQR